MNAAQHILVITIRFYRYTFSPAQTFLFGATGRCRFFPTCSQYALEAVRTHGALHGAWLAGRRIARCHPWGGCGDDPVPSPSASAPRSSANPTSCDGAAPECSR